MKMEKQPIQNGSNTPGAKVQPEELTLRLQAEIAKRERAEKVSRTVFDIAAAVNQVANLNELYRVIHQSLANVIDATNFFIALYDKEKDTLTFPYFVDEMDSLENYSQFQNISQSDLFSAEVIRTGKPLLMRKEAALRHKNKFHPRNERGVVGEVWLGVPLKIKGETMGVICTQSYRDPMHFTEKDIEIMVSVSDQVAIAIDHKRADEEAQRRSIQANLLYEVAQRVGSQIKMDELLNAVVANIHEVFKYSSVGIALVQEKNQSLVFRAEAGRNKEIPIIGGSIKIGQGITGWAVQTGQTQLCGDVGQNPHYFRAADENTKSELAIPLKLGNKVIGLLDIQNDEFDAFDDTDVSVLETLSTQIASAIENASLFEDSNRRAERLAVINRIGNAAAAAHNLDELMAAIYEEINMIFKPDAFFIAFLDHKTNELEFRLLIEEGQKQPLVRFPLGNGFSSKVILDKKPLIIRDYERDRHALPQGLIFGNQKPALSWIGVPLKYTDQIIGIVNIQSYQANAWDEEDIQLFFTIADQIAGTIEKARLFEEARVRAERLTVINRIGKVAAFADNLDKLMEAIYEEIHIIFKPDTFFIAFLNDKNNELEARFLMEEGKKLPITRYSIGSSLSSKVIVENKPLIIRNFNQEQNALPSGVLFGNQIPAQSWIGVPLKLGDQVIGLVNIQSKESNAWNDEDIQLFFTITDQIAGTIAKARLYEEARIRAERLTVINRIGKLAATADNSEKLMEAIYEEIDRSFHPDCFFIGIIDDKREHLEFRFLIENRSRLPNERQPIGSGWSSKVIEDKKPLIILDLDKEQNNLPAPVQVGYDMPAFTWIGVPLSFEDQVIGLVNIQSTKRNAWSEEDIQLFFTIADQLAGIIAKARLYEALEQELNERKKAEEKKKELEAQLRQAQKMEAIGTMAGGIAHDFNNVLYPIIGFAEMTMDLVPVKSVAQKNLVEIITAADRAKDLIQQILTFSRRQEHNPQPMKIQSIIKEALKLMRSSMPATISLVQNINEQCGPIMADPSQVHQIIMNLCTNAYYAMRKQGGILEVALSEINIQPGSSKKAFQLYPGLYLCLTVRDTGDGIDPLILDRIFDPYFTTKPPGEGTGMGLALVHGIVKSYGGEISVSSQPGKGTVFHICVPRIMETEKQTDILKQKCITGQGQTILFVDDEKQIIDMVKQMLESLNYKVVVQMDSIEALHEFQRKPEQFDLVITDQTMPRMTGFELSRKMLAMRKDLPIILCTGFSDLVNEEQVHAIGIRKFILKPIMKSQLSVLVHEILNKT